MKRGIISVPVAICFFIVLCAGFAQAFTPPSPPPPNKNLYETITLNKNLSKFLAMIDEAGLKDTLSANTGEPMTVFAPTNDALGNVPGDVMKRIKASPTSLQSFVKYHIIAGSAVSSGSIVGRRLSLAAANGEAISFDGSDRTKPPKIGDGTLAQMDIGTTNGVLHVINNALAPPSLAQAPVAPPPPPKQPQPPQAPVAAAPAPAPAPAAATTSAVRSAPLKITTSGVAQAPVGVTATGVKSTASKITTTGVATAPSAVDATTSSSGFTLFGHRFGW